ncbi:unnamed protein product, partial [Mesorhabditis belari]|uniref:Sex-determining region Y protein n=1 Tax=Mesorhabditis belari TaxID=2138241 RepID=A0AAF3E9H0_9BILA
MSFSSRDTSPSLSDSLSPPFQDKHGENSCGLPSPSPISHQAHDKIEPPEGKAFIKRPLNPYMCWVVIKRKELTKANPKMKMSDVNAKLGEMWKQLTDEERRPFFEQSHRSREEHKVLMNENPHLIFKPVNMKKKKPDEKTQTPKTPSNGHKSANGSEPSTPGASSSHSFSGFKAPALPHGQPISNHHHHHPSNVGSSVAQALGVRYTAPPQVQSHPPVPHPSQLQPGQMLVQIPGPPVYAKPTNMNQSLDQYYLSLCQPAFPHQGETPMTQYSSNFYWEQVQQIQYQSGHQL